MSTKHKDGSLTGTRVKREPVLFRVTPDSVVVKHFPTIRAMCFGKIFGLSCL